MSFTLKNDSAACVSRWLSVYLLMPVNIYTCKNQDFNVILVTKDNCNLSLLLIANIFPVNTVKKVEAAFYK